MKKLLRYLKPYTKESIIAPLFKLLEAGFDLLVPIVVKKIMDDAIPTGDTAAIWKLCGVLVLFALVGLLCSITAQYFAARAAVGFGTDLRRALFRKIGGYSYSQTDRAGTSTLITRMTADVNQLQTATNHTLRLLLRSPIIVIGSAIFAFTINARGATVFVVVIPLLAAVVFSIMLGGVPLYRKVQKGLDRVTSLTRENLTGVRVIRAFRKETEETERFDKANRAQTAMQNTVGRIAALMNPLTLLIIDGGIIALLYSGAIQVDEGIMTKGDVFALTNYMSQILVELVKLANTVIMINKGVAGAARIETVLAEPTGMPVDDSLPAPANAAGTAVAFDRVGLTYSEGAEPSLTDISFTAAPGETIGIIGSTGSGKTSVVNLIARFYDATSGTVAVDGVNVKARSPELLREEIGIVPQKAVLFRGTVRSNLLWGRNGATDDELWAALEQAQAKSFVEEKEGGLDAPVAQNGKNFSGGQRQRLTIARALVRKPSILILDDSSSALDYATDAALRAAIRNLDYHPTVFLISQRTSSICHADRILVLDDGRQVGLGTHEELLRTCPVYREIYDSQYRKEGADA